jgi:RsiW-degrading membrane proteinase PrsW (M82 family)
MQFGGQGIEVWNAFWSIVDGATLLESVLIFVGASTSILRLLWYYYVWNWIADNTEPTVSNASKAFVGTLLLLMATGFAVLVDVYALPDSPHLSGYTYVLTNPDIVTQPLAELLGQAASDPGTQEALNQTVNNSNITR